MGEKVEYVGVLEVISTNVKYGPLSTFWTHGRIVVARLL